MHNSHTGKKYIYSTSFKNRGAEIQRIGKSHGTYVTHTHIAAHIEDVSLTQIEQII